MHTKNLLIAAVVALCFAATGCQDVAEPEAGLATATAATVGDASADEISRLADMGIDLEGIDGVVAISWRERGRNTDTPELVGRAMAVALGEAADDNSRRPGIDMGDVVVNAPESDIALLRRERRGGSIFYSNLGKPSENPGVSVPFAAGASYTFDVSGAGDVAPANYSLTAPAALMEITSHAKDDVIGTSEDLVLEWGGDSGSTVMLRVVARKARGEASGERGRGNRGRGKRGHRGRPPLNDGSHLVEKFDTNPGGYTLSAAQLQELIGDADMDKLVVIVSQMDVSDFDAEGSTFKGIVRDGDAVVLTVE